MRSKTQTKTHHFDIEDAMAYGVNKAVLLQNLRFWLDKEISNIDRDEEDSGPKVQSYKGYRYVWTYNSSKAYEEQFPYMNKRTISRYLKELEDDGVIISGVFNKSAYDKTKWYTMPGYCIGQNVLSTSQVDLSTSQVGTSVSQSGQPIPDITPNSNPDEITDIFVNSSNLQMEVKKEIVPSKSKTVNPIWDALCQACNLDSSSLTKSEKSDLGRTVKELKEVDATPELILERALRWPILYPGADLTHRALRNNWSALTREKANSVVTHKQRDKAIDQLSKDTLQDEIFRRQTQEMFEEGLIDADGNYIKPKKIQQNYGITPTHKLR